MASISDKCAQFRALHAEPGIFVIPNPWDIVSARILAAMGFKALTTSSSASAAILGRRDGTLSRDEAIVHAQTIVEAVDIPVAADLENGFGDRPEDAAETIRRAAAAGLAGGSIEDSPSDRRAPVYELAHAAARVEAAAAAARESGSGFVLAARAENFIRGRRDLADTIARLQAYERAGADVLFAPGLPDLEAVRTVCASVSKPVNFMAGIPGASFSVVDLRAAGVKRVSTAGSLYRAAMQGLLDAAAEINEKGTFAYVERIVSTPEFVKYLR
jgi:2-methylisocitrate lyase-like PEP mutase family enzyme